MLLQFSPLFAQNEFIASIANIGDIVAGVHLTSAFVDYYHSDSSTFRSDWNFVDWDSRSFNPYKEQDLKEPFFLKFTDEKYAAPVNGDMVVTSRYGWRDGILHRGIDIDLVTGDDVYAVLDGKVRYVRSHAGHGKTVVIRHENGLETVYAHLSKQLVEENQIVSKGEVIGKGGTTGNARGSHLHLEVRYEGVTINPEYFFDFENGYQIQARESWITVDVADPRRFSSLKKASLSVARELAQDETESMEVEEVVVDPVVEDEVLEVDDPVILPDQKELEKEVGNTGPYTIKYGDTLYSLARKHHTTVEDICRVNGISDSFKIQVGQKILLDF